MTSSRLFQRGDVNFCERYRAFRQRLDVVMRQSHRAGEKLFVDIEFDRHYYSVPH